MNLEKAVHHRDTEYTEKNNELPLYRNLTHLVNMKNGWKPVLPLCPLCPPCLCGE